MSMLPHALAHPFDAAAVALARERGVPLAIFLSTAGDHYAAALAAELAADLEVQALLAAQFVCVDAAIEAHPALATRAQQVLAIMAGSAGWPVLLIALATATGVQLAGAVPYRPLRDRARVRGWASVLLDIAQRPLADVQHDAAQVTRMLGQFDAIAVDAKPLRPALICDAVAAAAMEAADTLEGGFGPAPRHPAPDLLEFVCAMSVDEPDEALGQQAAKSLAALVAGAVHDHLGGGFFRASQNADHSLPFFEKRAIDNLRLIPVLLRTGQPLYVQIARRTADWLRRDLLRDGQWLAALAADSPGADGRPAEGAFYAWNEAGFAAIVGSEGGRLLARCFLDTERSQVGKSGFYALTMRGELTPAEREKLPALVARAAMARADRPAPVACGVGAGALWGYALQAWAMLYAAGLQDAEDEAVVVVGLRAARFDSSTDVDALAAWARGLAECGRTAALASLMPEAAAMAQRALALACARRNAMGLFQLEAPDLVDPPAVACSDGPDAPHAAGLLTQTAGILGQAELARELAQAHAGLLRRAPLAGASLALSLMAGR